MEECNFLILIGFHLILIHNDLMNLKFNNENLNPRMPLSRYIRNADNITREKNSSNNSIHDNGDYKLENVIG